MQRFVVVVYLPQPPTAIAQKILLIFRLHKYSEHFLYWDFIDVLLCSLHYNSFPKLDWKKHFNLSPCLQYCNISPYIRQWLLNVHIFTSLISHPDYIHVISSTSWAITDCIISLKYNSYNNKSLKFISVQNYSDSILRNFQHLGYWYKKTVFQHTDC